MMKKLSSFSATKKGIGQHRRQWLGRALILPIVLLPQVVFSAPPDLNNIILSCSAWCQAGSSDIQVKYIGDDKSKVFIFRGSAHLSSSRVDEPWTYVRIPAVDLTLSHYYAVRVGDDEFYTMRVGLGPTARSAPPRPTTDLSVSIISCDNAGGDDSYYNHSRGCFSHGRPLSYRIVSSGVYTTPGWHNTSPASPKEFDTLTWTLSDTPTGLVINSKTGEMSWGAVTVATNGAAPETTISEALNINIPTIQFSGGTYSAHLKYSGTKNGRLSWVLESYEKSVNRVSCNFPYPKALSNSHNPKVTAAPTCEQQWNWWNFNNVAFPLISFEMSQLNAKINNTLGRQIFNSEMVKVVQATVEIVKLSQASIKGEGAEKVAEALVPIVINNSTRWLSVDSSSLAVLNETKGLLLDITFAAIGGTVNPVSAIADLAPKTFDVIQTFVASFLIGELNEQVNELFIARWYLFQYYQFRGSEQDTSEFYTGNSASSFEEVIKKVAKKHGYENTLLSNDYNFDKVKEIVDYNRDTVVPNITKATMGK